MKIKTYSVWDDGAPHGLEESEFGEWVRHEDVIPILESFSEMKSVLRRIRQTVPDSEMFEDGEDPHPPSVLYLDVCDAIGNAQNVETILNSR